MITGRGNSLSAQLLTCSHILGGFWIWGPQSPRPPPPPPPAPHRESNRKKSQRGALIVYSGCAACRRLSAVTTGAIPERCVPGARPANTARTHHCGFDSPFRPSAVLPASQCCCSDGSLKLFAKRSSRLGSGRWECFTNLNSRCCYAREPPVGIEPTTVRLRSACSTN